MNINQLFPGNWLKASDLPKPVLLTIDSVSLEKFDDGQKPALHFSNCEQGMILNKINCNTIAEYLGAETDHWRGKQVVVYQDWTDFSGKRVQCIRVRPPRNYQAAPQAAPAPATLAPHETTPAIDDMEQDDVPF